MQLNAHLRQCHYQALVYITLMLGLIAPNLARAYTSVTIVMSAATPVNQEFINQLKTDLKNTPLNIKVVEITDSEKLVLAENSELVIALGIKALEVASKLKHTTPVLGVFIPSPTFNRLLTKSHRELGNFSAIVLDQPYKRQLSLIKTVLPTAKKIGVLLGESSLPYDDLVKNKGDEAGYTIQSDRVYQENDLQPKLKQLLDTNDALLAIPDPLIYNRETAQPILLTSYRYQKPIFGYSQSYVRAGALAAVYTSSKQLATQAAEIAIKSQQAPSLLPVPQSPKYFSVMVNYQVGRSLNIPLMDETVIYKKILATEIEDHDAIQY